MDENPFKAPAPMPPASLRNNAMTPEGFFHVAIATLGLVLLLWGVLDLFHGATIALHLAEPAIHRTTPWYAVKGIFLMLLGYFVMSNLSFFSRLAFSEDDSSAEGPVNSDSNIPPAQETGSDSA